MSKIKLSFSLFFAIFLVVIFSTATFARSAYGLGVAADGNGGFNFSFTKVASDSATDFTLNVYSYDPATKAYTNIYTHPFTNVGTTQVQFDVSQAVGIQVGTIYNFELSHTTAGDVVGEKMGVLTDSHNLKMANVKDLNASGSTTFSYTKSDGTIATIDVKGSGLANSNHTGADSAKKPNQSTHGFYQNNTNSCAVCHQTHTSGDGGTDGKTSNLLMKNGTYSTCTACHDGTTGGYNAFADASAETANSIAGTFNVTMDGASGAHNGSIHDADGSLKVSAAPGGNSNPGSKTPFSSSFDCASCHNPHGGGGASVGTTENNLNQDPLGWGSLPYGKVGDPSITWHDKTVTFGKDSAYGKMFVNPTIYNPGNIPSTNVAPYIFVLNTNGVDLSTLDQTTAEYYYLNRDGYVSGQPIPMTYRWQKGGYTPDFSLWLQEKGYPFKADTALYNDVWTNLSLTQANNYNDASKDITRATNVTVVWKDGFAYGAGVVNVKSAQISLGVNVNTTPFVQTLYQTGFTGSVKNQKTGVTTNYSYIPDSGVQMSQYCASCHTDYLSVTRNDNTGVYTQAHRHMTLADETNCIRCHYGHGTDATIMHDANDNTQFTTTDPVTGGTFAHTGDLNYFKDVNPSSALKRYTGMSVCYACHGQGEQFLGNPNNVDRPLFGQPGTTTRNADPTKAGE